MTETKNQAALEATQSVSALGLRWAALRGMLNSPLIMAEDQRSLRDELLQELESLEQDFSALQSRNTLEISAKVDIAKSALQDRLQPGQSWLIDLLESIQIDLHIVPAKSATGPGPRSTVNLTRSHPARPEEASASAGPENGMPSAA